MFAKKGWLKLGCDVLGVSFFLCAGMAQAAEAQEAANLKLFGDVRVRGEVNRKEDVDDAEPFLNTRGRIRARLGVRHQTGLAGLDLGLRVVTSLANPGNSPHQTFSVDIDQDAGNPLALDQAFIRYRPVENLTLVAGKHAYAGWQQSEVFWDADVMLEGYTLYFRQNLGEAQSLRCFAGHYSLIDSKWQLEPFHNDTMTMWQLLYAGAYARWRVHLAFNAAHMRDANDDTNQSGDVQFADTDFTQSSLRLSSVGFVVNGFVGAEYFYRLPRSNDVDKKHHHGHGGLLGLSVQDYALTYAYYDIKETATPFYMNHSFSLSDFAASHAGLTGFRGHILNFKVVLAPDVHVLVRYTDQTGRPHNLYDFSEVPGRHLQRFQLNLNASF